MEIRPPHTFKAVCAAASVKVENLQLPSFKRPIVPNQEAPEPETRCGQVVYYPVIHYCDQITYF